MLEYVQIDDMPLALEARELPTVTLWNRIEARPRSDQFDRALKAEIRDPLWMLTRQWQMGEFEGDDAGSPIFAKIHMATTRLTRYRAAEHPTRAFSEDVPLEAQVEQRPIPFHVGDQYVSLDLRLAMGRQWIKLLNKAGLALAAGYRQAYAIDQPDPDDAAQAQVVAHRDAWQQVAAVAGERAMDGYALYAHLKAGGDPADGLPAPPSPADALKLAELAPRFAAWYEALFFQPDEPDENAWKPSYLEYQFACSAPEGSAEKVYTADAYYQGRLDWYSVDIDPDKKTIDGEPPVPPPADVPPPPTTTSFVPTQVTYDGMPNTRWWAFEDRKTNFGDIAPDTTDIGKLLFMEFGLVFANDWFLVPHTLPAGSIASVRGMAVTNVFGERIWIEPAGKGPDDAWQRWAMFTVSRRGIDDAQADTRLLLLPTVPKVQEGPPVDDVLLIRDEMANMVWGVERRIPLPSGASKPGNEAGYETRGFHQRLLRQGLEDGSILPDENVYRAPIRYEVMNTVPEHWIPFVPVHVPGSNREIQLQRAALPRVLDGAPADQPPVKVEPRSLLLRHGLDASQPYFLHEEEVTRAGIRVTQAYQRTRWYGGKVVTWFGARKQTGRGEGSSGLAFDRVVEVPFAPEPPPDAAPV
ncbi:MAG: hypothetical protein R2834_11750 [Rhodothermales bacterium]